MSPLRENGQHARASLLVLLHALESLFKFCDQRSFAGLETAASHDAPEKTATRVRIVHGHQVFGMPACHEDDDVGFGGPVHDYQFAPLLNGVLHGADRVPIFGKQVRIELISVIGGHVDIVRIRQNARKRWRFRGTRTRRSRCGNRRQHKYQEYGQSIGALAKQYTTPNPDALMKAKQAGNISLSPGQGTVALVIKNYVKQGDSVTLTIDPQSKQLQNVRVASYLNDPKDAVTISAEFAQLPDGTNHVASTLINGESKQVTVNEVNSNYQKQ